MATVLPAILVDLQAKQLPHSLIFNLEQNFACELVRRCTWAVPYIYIYMCVCDRILENHPYGRI